MDPQPDARSVRSDERAQRRWLIGIAVTVVFGVFGAVMALLAYTNRPSAPPSRGPAKAAPQPSAPQLSAPQPSAPPPASPPDEPRGKGNGKDHRRK